MGKRIVQPVIVSASTPMVSQMAEWLLARATGFTASRMKACYP